MKMKNLAGAFLALAAMFGFATVRAADIYDVHACDKYGKSIDPSNLPFYTPDESMGSGVTAYFKVRFLPRQEMGQFSTNLWQFVYTGISSQNVQQPKIGIFVSGVQSEATYIGMPDVPEVAGTLPTGEAYYYSDLIFAYTTKPGDFALPVVLAAKGADGRPTPASDVSTKISEYFLVNQGQNGWKLQFPMYDGSIVPSASWSIAAGVPNLSRLGLDPSLSKAGYCVKTVDFAAAWEKPGEAWRVVHQGSTKTEKYEPQLEARPAAAVAEVLYVWSDDENSVVVDGREVTSEAEWQSMKEKLSLKEPVWMTRNVYLPETGKTKTRRVAMVKIDGGATTGDLTLRGVTQDTSTKLYLSAYDHFNVSDATSDDVVDYVTVPVACSEPLPPSVTVTTSTADAIAAYNYGHAAARITVSLPSADYAATVPAFTVKLMPRFNAVIGVTKPDITKQDEDGNYLWGEYVRFSEDLQDVGKNLPEAKSLPTVTLGGGSGKDTATFYVFCLRADKWTQNENLIEFVPSSEDAPEEIATWTPGGFNVTAQIPEITEPEEGAKIEGNVYQYDDYPLTVKVEGSYADGLSATGYTVRVRYGNGDFETLSGTYFPNGEGNVLTKTGTTSERPLLNFPESGENQTADIEVIAPASGRKSSEPDTVYRRIVADVKKQKTIGVEVTLPRKTEAIDTIDEGRQVAFTVHLSDAYPGASAVYAFIQVTNEYVRAGQFDFKAVPPFIVGCTNKAGETVGLEIPRGTTVSVAKQNTVTLLDGYDDLDGGLTLDFNVLLSTEKEWSKAQLKPIKGYSMDGSEYSLTLMVTNVMPSVKSVKLDGTAVKTDPENPTRVAASDTRWQKFEVALDEPSDYDVKNDVPSFYEDVDDPGFRLKWEAYLDGEYQVGETLADFHSKTVAFSNLFETVGSWEIRIWAKDKDMAAFTDDDEPTYSFPLEVVDSPTIVVNGGVERRVNETDARATVEVELSLWPKEVTGTLVVELTNEVGRVGTKGDWGELVLETNRIEFTKSNWNRKQSIRIFRMDGTDLTGLYGYDVQGKAVAVVSASGAESAAPNLPCVAGRVYIDNEAPNGNDESRSFSPDVNTNVWEVAGGAATTHPLKFFVRTDVDRDFTATATNDDWKVSEGVWTNGIKVTIMGGGGESYNTDGFVNGVKYFSDAGNGTFIPNFGSSQGDQEVTIMIDDKDGGHLSRTWKFTVTPSKYLTTVATGPSGGTSSSALSQKYSGASGLGEGHVFALDKTFTKANDFRLHWNCSKDAKASLYAWGYKVGAVDDGTLDTHDQPLDTTGAAAAGVTPSSYYHYGDPELDSFLYCWIQTVTDEKGAETSSYLGALAPERAAKTGASMAEITLPDMNKDAKDNVYPETVVEAIFAREWLSTDNMGDINWDGIPDLYVNQYKFDVIDETTGAIAEGGKDLKSLRDYNADLDKDGAASPDYLPTGSEAIFGTFVPDRAETWKEMGKEFTALLEIRGYGDGLNDAPVLAGITGVKPDRIYEDPDLSPTSTLSKVEFLAWSEFKAAYEATHEGDEATVEMWSPERPTSPILDDTDGDEFADGYEYYFWYKAHVGYLDANGVHRYLTGRAYDPRNPGEGKFIDSATIARMMDPRHDLKPVDFPANYVEDPSNAKTRDTDNDGLPDLLEFEIGTNPFDFDTDGDGLPDGWEVMISGTDPLKVYTTGSISDAMRNFDGDAMAFTTPKLERDTVMPKPLHTDDLFSFALVKPDGDTDGIQWYVGKAAPTNVAVGETGVACTLLTVGSQAYVTTKGVATFTTADGRIVLATDLAKDSAWTAIKPDDKDLEPFGLEIEDGYVRLMPTRIPAGTVLAGEPEAEQTCCSLVLGGDVKDVNAAWVYGHEVDGTTTGNNLANQGGFGMLAIGRYEDAKAGVPIAALPKADENIAYLHYLVYQEFGFDPRTAWNANTPLGVRWGTAKSDGTAKDNVYDAKSGYAGIATRTREYTAYDEFLVFSFFLNNGMKVLTYEMLGDTAPTMAELWYANTTNPQGPGETVDADGADAEGEAAKYWGRGSDNGADTDGDGVPDGWELYVMAGKKANGKYHFAFPYEDGYYSSFGPFMPHAKDAGKTDSNATSGFDSIAGDDDGLTEYQEFEGTDSTGYYMDETRAPATPTIVHDAAWTWFNKFFPTDPWDEDTDKDGLKDAEEKGKFGYGEPADNGKRKSIPGGGLNPCSVDTDQDGLPDGWEAQFPGNKSSLYAGEDADYAPDAAGNQGNPLQGLTDGMDGTVFDAYNTVYVNRTTSTAAGNEAYSLVVSIDGAKQVVDRDYDHDGLENWQEYLVGAMRCWRYDDPLSRWTSIPTEWYYDEDGIFNPFREDGRYLRLLGIDTSAEDEGRGEFWYRTLYDKTSPAYNPHLVTGTGSGAQYFSRVTNGFDPNFTDTGTYYIFHDRVNDAKIEDLWGFKAAPQKYISCSPVKADTDGDGMDDYYELFHGLNPLLGGVGRRTGNELIDVVYDAWYVENADSPVGDAEKNLWTLNAGRLLGREPRTNDPKNNKYDFELFPWLAGLAGADPDGDDLRNQDESLMPMVAPSDQYHHTDPTPLWMTDSSYTNSFVSRFYKLPATFTDIVLMRDTFEYDGKEWPFYDRDGFYFDAMGGCHLAPFTADHWNLTSVSSKNWAFSFEENEGYDTDHDGISDFEELKRVPTGTVSDPQEADSPHRRQAMYFAGPDAQSALQTMPFVKEGHPRYGYGYPDDMSFREYTVECWVRPESAADATVIERAIWSSYSAAGDEELMRKNFQIAIRGGCWYTKFDANGTLEDSLVELQSTKPAKVGEWTHVAATYDGAVLRLYVNGEEALKDGISGRGLTPEYGSSAVVVYPGSGATLTNGLYVGRDDRYWFDVEYPLHAIIIGASAKTQADFGGPTQVHNSHLNVMNGRGWDRYRDFFRGYVDEVRIWDGARKPGDIRADMMKRYTAADVSANRDKFYGDWAAGNRRYEKNGAKNPDVTPELRYHWTFDSLPGAENPEMAAKSAHGFGYVGADGETHAGSKAPLARPVGYEIAWWRQILDGYTGTVYCNPAYVTWVPNTVTHLPRFDTTTLDSFYWAGDTKGVVDGTYGFARTAEPVSRWTQYQRDGAFAMATTAGGTQTSEYSDFKTTPRRFWQANVDGIGNMSLLFEFTGRHLNQQGDDLLPLGGAYVKYVDAMWDGQGASTASEITGTDEDNNGLADWWQKYAVERYSPELAEGQEMKWTTFVTYRGRRMTAGEAYLLDLAHGLYADRDGNIVTDPDLTKRFVNRADEDRDGLPDWWEKHYGIHTGDTVPTGTAHANEDPDNDGLSNYNEFLLSEVFDFAGLVFDPTRTCSVDEYTPDYFYRVGELYVGEIFADHDLVDDAWEDIYGNDFASRLAWDAFADADQDGWSNRSENRYSKAVMPIVADQREHYTAADGLVADYPIPTLSLTLSYNGNRQNTVRTAPMVIQVTTDTTLAKDPDATYLIGAAADKTAGTGTTSTEGTGASSSTETSHTRTIGKWSNRHAIGTLTPGNIKQNSLALEFCYDPSSVIYSWRVWPLGRGSYYEDKRGTRLEYDAEKRKYGDANIEFVGADTSYAQLKDLEVRPGEDSSTAIWFHTKSGLELGTVNLVTGEFDINLGVFKDQYVENGTNESDYVSLEDQTFRIAYAANPSVGLPRELYLGTADTGHVKEGKNTIMAWAETVTADGKWQVGEPYGIVRDVDVSWRGTKAEIELTDISPVTPRIDLTAAGGSGGESKDGGQPAAGDPTAVDAASDRGETVSAIKARIREQLEYDYSGASPVLYSNALERLNWMNVDIIDPATITADTFRNQRIRVVRWLINDHPAYSAGSSMRTVLDKTIETDVRSVLTEADFLVGNGSFDLDWDHLYDEVINNARVERECGKVRSVSYLVVVGDGPADWSSISTSNYTVRALNSVIVRKFGEEHIAPAAVAPGAVGEEIVHGANPTFKWTMDCPEEEGYTAFNVQVMDGSTLVYDSDTQLAPPRNAEGQYVWTAPLYVGDKTLKGKVFENKKAYTWKVSMYNAKFSNAAVYSNAGKFFMEVQTNGTDYGTANVAVRYFGPTNTYAKWSPVVRVQAFTSPDFTGRPVAAGFVEDVTTLTNANRELAANCRVIGLEPGSYYLQAFVDSNGNGICDPWETQGYLCARDGSTADWLDPTTISFATSVGAGDLAVIYLEDADTDGDGLPDAWEWANASDAARADGTFLDERSVELLTETKAGERLYNKALTKNQELKLQDGASWPDGGLEGLLGSRFLNNAGMVYLAMGAPAGKGGFTEAIEAALAPELEEGGVTIRELGLRDGRVTVALGIETTSGAETPLAKFFDAGGKLTVVCEILWTPSLAQDPKVIYSEDVVVGDEPAEFDISAALEKAQAEAGVDGGSAFFSARVYKK